MRTHNITRVGMLAALVGMMVYSLGAPAWASTGQDGPTPPELGDPVSSPVPDVQIVSVYLTSGTYTLDLAQPAPGCTTGPIAWNASNTVVDAAITACASGIDVSVERSQTPSAYVYKVRFANPDGDLTQMAPTPSGAGNVIVSTYQNGVDPATWFKPDGLSGVGTGTVSTTAPPHGGFSSGTDYCLQCHSVHNAGTEFALLRDANVTATCQTCHSLFAAAATGAYDSNFATGENTRLMGSAAARSAYDLGDGSLIGGGAIVRGHQIGGIGGGLDGDYSLTDGARLLYAFDSARRNGETLLTADTFPASEVSGASQDGLYCGSCHTPHGDIGQLVNNWKPMTSDFVGGTADGTIDPIGTATLVSGSPSVVLTFPAGSPYDGTGFSSAQRKLTLRIETDTTAQADFYTRVFNQFRNQGTTTASSAGYTGAWATCAWNPAAADPQTICITDLPTVSGTFDVYLGDEGRPISGSATTTTPTRVDYDGTAGAWRSCADPNVPTLGTGFNAACTAYATATDAEGQTVSLYGYKLLSSGPNHQMAPRGVMAYATTSGSTDAWCGTCHETRFDDGTGIHPTHSASGGCTACHGNPADGSSFDYPHTSTVSRLLKALPDGLCLTCHSQLP